MAQEPNYENWPMGNTDMGYVRWKVRQETEPLHAIIDQRDAEIANIAKEGWRSCIDHIVKPDAYCPVCVINKRDIEIGELNNLIAELEAEREWIPVSERLPEGEDRVLTFSLDKGNLDTCTGKYIDLAVAHGGVTHWMPLPTPPEE